MQFVSQGHRLCTLIAAAFLLMSGNQASGIPLVSDEAIKLQKEATSQHRLKNGIPVIIRQVPDSDILHVNVSFAAGLRDLPPGRKALNDWLWATLPMAGKGYPKDKVFELTEKYGLEIGCSAGIEMTSCALGTLNEYWGEALPLLAALIQTPSLTDEDAKLTKDRLIARLRNAASDPGSYVNEIVNTIFYPVGHPYRLNHDEALAELDKLTPRDLAAMHKQVLDPSIMSIVVVTSMPGKTVLADLERRFGGLSATASAGKGASKPTAGRTAVEPPVFNAAQAYAFHDRELPTAYMRIKFNAPAVTDKDAVATRFLYEVLSEELGEEIRTRRSLSYAVHAYVLQYSMGVGVLSASTSRPKETLEAMHEVLQRIKTKTYDAKELEEYKHVFATAYFLGQETHASIAASLASSLHFYGDAEVHYELPRKLAKVTPADVKRLANDLLVDPRVGVIYGRKDFQDTWAKDFIDKNRRAPAKKGS